MPCCSFNIFLYFILLLLLWFLNHMRVLRNYSKLIFLKTHFMNKAVEDWFIFFTLYDVILLIKCIIFQVQIWIIVKIVFLIVFCFFEHIQDSMTPSKTLFYSLSFFFFRVTDDQFFIHRVLWSLKSIGLSTPK